VLIVIAIGGLVEITPLFYLKSTIEKVDGVRPYTPLELAGRNIYVREGCYNCHSQMIRTLRDEVERYGHYSLAAESMYDPAVPVGLENAPDPIWRASARNIPTSGTAITARAEVGGARDRDAGLSLACQDRSRLCAYR
jgi:cbb3-type cytochrome c oxidase subunit II